MTIPFESGLVLAAILFVIGLLGVLARRNILIVLMSVEIMLNAAGLLFIAAASRWARPDGQVMFLFILAVAASEVAVGLALILQLRRRFKSLSSDDASTMKG
jgi:NADH-quinone oxidoreductase subunit K